MLHLPEKYRIQNLGPRWSSTPADGNNGALAIPGPCGRELFCICSDGLGWEHVSVSLKNRCPNWPEMAFIKSLFWDEEDLVVQYHPPKSEYVNNHRYCLHLWRPIGIEIPRPNHILVGVRSFAMSSGEAMNEG